MNVSTKSASCPTSNNRAQCFCKRILSPLASVNSLLSSITEFIFSTHRASTSLSKTIYLRSFLSVGLLISRKMQDNNPSVQSLVTGSSVPYSSTTVHALAFITYSLVEIPRLKEEKTYWMGGCVGSNTSWTKTRDGYIKTSTLGGGANQNESSVILSSTPSILERIE